MLPTLETRVADHETRISMLEGINAQINERLNGIDTRLNNIDTRVTSMIKWIIGLLFTILATNIATSIALLNLLSK